MASTEQPNGTHFPSLPHNISAQEGRIEPASDSRLALSLTPPLQPTSSEDANSAHPQGRTSIARETVVPAWNAQALLAPRKVAALSSQPQQLPPRRDVPKPKSHLPSAPPLSSNGDGLVFQFASPSASDPLSSNLPSTSSTPVTDAPSTPITQNQPSGLGGMIERINAVQDRASAPVVKRRKLDTPESDVLPPADNKKTMTSGGTGVLGAYVKERRDEGKQDSSARGTQTVDLTEGDDIEVVRDPGSEEVCYGMLGGTLQCHTVPSARPGAKSIFGDGWYPHVKVVLKRLAGDRTLRLQAYDFTREIIGNVDERTAEALVPLLDANIRVRTDCRIPARKGLPNEEPGKPTSKAYPLEIILYGPMQFAKAIGGHLLARSMNLRHPNRVDKGIKYMNPQAGANDRPAARKPVVVQHVHGHHGYTPGTNITPRTVEEIRSDVLGVFDSLGKTDDLPEQEPPAMIVTPLLKHQKQGLYFMSHKETTLTPEERLRSSYYRIRTGPHGEKVFYNVVTAHAERRLPPQTRGGILADMMGLGKTLTVLALVCSSLDQARQWAGVPPVQPETPPLKNGSSASNNSSLGLTQLKRNAKTTLLVCPLSTVTNWEEQIKQHIAPGSLSYYVYHGSSRIKDIGRLAQYDLVITTYGSVSSELSARSKRKAGQYPIEEIGWFRIVLDEAHMIREVNTLQFKAVVRLQASRRWSVTGTPVQNRLDDLAALLQFLRLKPFDDRNKFNRFIIDPFKNYDAEIIPKLRILVDTITLRRLKDKIDLPPRTDEIIKLDFTPEERQVYDLFEKNAQDRVKVLAGDGTGVGKALGGHTYIHILRSILRLRLLCAHGKDLLNGEDLEALQGMTADMAIDLDSDEEDDTKPAMSDRQAYEMFELMQDTNTDACSVCARKLGSSDSDSIESEGQEDLLGYMTRCFHVICSSSACLKSVKARADASPGQCPICQNGVTFQYVELRRTRANAEHDGHIKKAKTSRNGKRVFDKYEGPHTKTRALIEDLLQTKAETASKPEEATYKSVVFSTWTSHLDLIQMGLDSAGITYTRLDGTMSRTARTAAMDKFREDPSVEVILVSITAGGLGLNLTAANNVYVMEPQYNPAAEAQAIDRVHRLGQKRPVRTVRYIMRNSFEEKMLELQDKKKKLASLSMDGKDRVLERGDAARQRLMDLRSLFK
ncbi:SNF2 family domain-containing protein [Sodiomyces alkalinus F11]|uniref:SNF2 family domain-containing protein n=1 Tax=Sodiomyces alkalinus (strain CBS 110278 / VKM F-3762 / F11) TaxID=1314773 RepID=A0A3N2PVV8_SODAK|nr:SNF2 family domain-containing protein [Sodiomyces alkalinus F11]ROT38635.1 SNF2 family domain-containing protein [Sodiomyces alkalinus F11]